MQIKYVSLVELKGYILRNPALHGKPLSWIQWKRSQSYVFIQEQTRSSWTQ